MSGQIVGFNWDCNTVFNNEEEKVAKNNNYAKWSVSGESYFGCDEVVDKLPPGFYGIYSNQSGQIYFGKKTILANDIINFPATDSEVILNEIERFWNLKDLYQKHGLLYKRGYIFTGPPGSGKSSIIQLVSKQVISLGGIVIDFVSAKFFASGMELLRKIEPNKPVVVLMEDIDSIIRANSESEVLNILDGVNQIDNIVYIATTNYPEQLGERIINRPSRFDKRFKIGYPSSNTRKIYFEHLLSKSPEINIDIDKWVKDTKGYSVAHMKELFITVNIFNNSYESCVERLNTMRNEKLDSLDDDDSRGAFGFVVDND